MFRSDSRPAQQRRAVILMVVVVMLTLLAVIGIGFVLYAESQATSSRVFREFSDVRDVYPSAEEMLGWMLGQLIYDVPDDDNRLYLGGGSTGIYSAMRGNSLARTEYGSHFPLPPGWAPPMPMPINWNTNV